MQSTEIWKPVPNYEGSYEVSSQGQVKSLARINAAGKSLRERMLTPQLRTDGYYQVELRKDGKRRSRRIHTLVLLAFVGEPGPGQICRHLDGNPGNNRLENLAWGTQTENIEDQIRHGTHGMARKTHCFRGHELSEENLVKSRPDGRICLACTRSRTYLWNRGLPMSQDLADEHYAAIVNGTPSPTKIIKTHCPRGHKLESPNLVPSRLEQGHRICLACSRGRATRQHAGTPVDVAADAHYEQIMDATRLLS